MNGDIFTQWVERQLLPNLPRQSVVVMDNASYHSIQEAGAKPPTMATRKADMQKWLTDIGVVYDARLTKPKLYEIVQQHKSSISKSYQIDNVIANNGHFVLRLPPYHCDLNPIELIWADVKSYVSRNNTNFKTTDVKGLIQEAFTAVDSGKWRKACQHVAKIETMYWKKDNIQVQTVAPIIIALDEDTEEESDVSSVASDENVDSDISDIDT